MMLSERDAILKEIVDSVGDEMGREAVAKKVERFMKHGTIFLFFELMNLRKEIELMKGRTQATTTVRQSKR